MTFKLKGRVENAQHVVETHISGDMWKKYLNKAEKSLFDNLEIKGFRKGKVPQEIAKKYISSDKVRAQAVEKMIDEKYPEILKELQKEKIITRPKIIIKKISDDEAEVEFSSAIYPEIKLGKTKGFKTKWEVEKVDDKEIELEIKRFEQHLSKTQDIKEDRKLKKGDIANINFVGKKDGKAFEGGTAENYPLEIGSRSFIPGFEEQITGMKKGETKVVELTFPENYQVKELAGKDVTFDVTLNSIQEKVQLEGKELDERLKILGFKSFDDMKSKIREMLEDRKKSQANDKYFNKVAEEILNDDNTKLEIPQELIQDEIENELKEFEKKLSKQGMNLKKYLDLIKKTKEEFVKENLEKDTRKKIETGLIYTQLIADLDVTPTDKDVDDELQKIADSQGVSLKEIKKNIDETQVKNAIQFQKLIDMLKSNE